MATLQNLNEQGIALQGYDPVSYFTSAPTVGNESITSTYEGAIYRFANEANKAKFDADPQR